jgi:glycosyltransferase involved in cell wall biosynthesis
MDINKALVIAYSGSLDGYKPKLKTKFIKTILQWIWTFKNNNIDSSTRTAHYLIQAIKVLKQKYSISPNQLQIHLWGKIDQENISSAAKEDVSEFFIFSGYLPKQESLNKLQQADLLFLPLERASIKGNKTLFIPGKLFEYLHTRKPILALCEDSDCKDILKKSGLGICIEPDNFEEVASFLNTIIHDSSIIKNIQANEEFIETFSFVNKTKELAKVLNDVLVN